MGAVDELKGLMWTEILISSLMQEIKKLREVRDSLARAKKGGSLAARVVEMEEKLCAEVDCYLSLRENVLNILDMLEDRRLGCVLMMRYANNMSWDEIAAEAGWSKRHVQRLHEQGLREIEKAEAGIH